MQVVSKMPNFQNKVMYTQYLVDPDYLLNAQVRVKNVKILEARQIFSKIFLKVNIVTSPNVNREVVCADNSSSN